MFNIPSLAVKKIILMTGLTTQIRFLTQELHTKHDILVNDFQKNRRTVNKYKFFFGTEMAISPPLSKARLARGRCLM